MQTDIGDMNVRLVKALTEKKLKISTAESCTGGLLAALITQAAGASEVFEESIVTYSNEAKMRELGVKKETLDKFGAVSHDTAYQMCTGICAHTGADIGVGITGIAGPGGGTAEKPVGTVFIGVCVTDKVQVMEMHFAGDRDAVRLQTCRTAIETVMRMI